VGVVLALGELGVVEAVGVSVDGSVNIAMDELPKMKISRAGGRRSSEEMSNSMDELQLSLLKSLLKYFYHLFLISPSLVRSRSVASLMHFTWMMSLVFLFWLLVILYMSFSPSFTPNRWYNPSYI
jgi:hypothetical protein